MITEDISKQLVSTPFSVVLAGSLAIDFLGAYNVIKGRIIVDTQNLRKNYAIDHSTRSIYFLTRSYGGLSREFDPKLLLHLNHESNLCVA